MYNTYALYVIIGLPYRTKCIKRYDCRLTKRAVPFDIPEENASDMKNTSQSISVIIMIMESAALLVRYAEEPWKEIDQLVSEIKGN